MKLKTSDKRWTIQQHTQLYYRITSSLASITFNHRLGHCASGSQILSRGSIKYTLFTLYYSLITGLLVLWGQNYGIQYLVKNAWVLENLPRFRGCTPNPIPLHEFAPFLGCETPPPPPCWNLPLCINIPRYGVCDALPHPHPCFRSCIPFTHFSLGPSLKTSSPKGNDRSPESNVPTSSHFKQASK